MRGLAEADGQVLPPQPLKKRYLSTRQIAFFLCKNCGILCMERTIRAAFDGMDDVLDIVEKSCAEVLEAGNHEELEQVQQDVITIQEAVLALHKAQQ